MAKIGRGRYRWDDHWGDYDIMYSSKEKHFYADAAKLFEGSGEFFDSLYMNEKKTEGLNMQQATYGRQSTVKQIFAKSEKEVEDAVNLFNKLFVTTETAEEKVILYSFDYETETQRKDRDRFYMGGHDAKKFSMEFKYHIAKKKILGPNKIYTEFGTSIRIDRYDVHNFKEIPWSQELEDFIKSFSKSFDGLVNRMKPFFEVDGKIIELIGKNILTP